jgi:exopolyphosphatase/pppGpp-phosphohydrolase
MISKKDFSLREIILNLGAKYKCDMEHCFLVEEFALNIFDSLKSLHKLDDNARRLLSHACLIHDVGFFIDEKKHHKHAKYIVLNDSLMEDYPQKEKEIISLIAYNHRKKLHEGMSELDSCNREIVTNLSAVIRVADSLDYTRENLKIEKIYTQDKSIIIALNGSCRNEDMLLRKKELFCSTFGYDIRIQQMETKL